MVSHKISKSYGIISRIRNTLDIKSKKNIYYSLIHPYLTYCINVWSSTYRTNFKTLCTAQKRSVCTLFASAQQPHSRDQHYTNSPLLCQRSSWQKKWDFERDCREWRTWRLYKVTGQDFFFSCPLYFFPHSFSSSYFLPLFHCLISILLFPCASVWENTRVWVPHFLSSDWI